MKYFLYTDEELRIQEAHRLIDIIAQKRNLTDDQKEAFTNAFEKIMKYYQNGYTLPEARDAYDNLKNCYIYCGFVAPDFNEDDNDLCDNAIREFWRTLNGYLEYGKDTDSKWYDLPEEHSRKLRCSDLAEALVLVGSITPEEQPDVMEDMNALELSYSRLKRYTEQKRGNLDEIKKDLNVIIKKLENDYFMSDNPQAALAVAESGDLKRLQHYISWCYERFEYYIHNKKGFNLRHLSAYTGNEKLKELPEDQKIQKTQEEFVISKADHTPFNFILPIETVEEAFSTASEDEIRIDKILSENNLQAFEIGGRYEEAIYKAQDTIGRLTWEETGVWAGPMEKVLKHYKRIKDNRDFYNEGLYNDLFKLYDGFQINRNEEGDLADNAEELFPKDTRSPEDFIEKVEKAWGFFQVYLNECETDGMYKGNKEQFYQSVYLSGYNYHKTKHVERQNEKARNRKRKLENKNQKEEPEAENLGEEVKQEIPVEAPQNENNENDLQNEILVKEQKNEIFEEDPKHEIIAENDDKKEIPNVEDKMQSFRQAMIMCTVAARAGVFYSGHKAEWNAVVDAVGKCAKEEITNQNAIELYKACRIYLDQHTDFSNRQNDIGGQHYLGGRLRKAAVVQLLKNLENNCKAEMLEFKDITKGYKRWCERKVHEFKSLEIENLEASLASKIAPDVAREYAGKSVTEKAYSELTKEWKKLQSEMERNKNAQKLQKTDNVKNDIKGMRI